MSARIAPYKIRALVMLLAFAACAGRATTEPSAVDAKKSHAAVEALEQWLAKKPADRSPLDKQSFATVSLIRTDAAKALELLWKDLVETRRAARRAEWEAKKIRVGEHEMKFDYRTFGEKPKDGWDLYLSMHGGGGAPAPVNEAQWRNQIKLYQPKQALYVAPRAPTDAWNMWRQAHMDPLLDRLIEGAVLHLGANPNRVYLMGYSAGGDGVYQLAPRMADRFAAAAMMAGHPNDASPLGLRNIGFTIHVGELDAAYKRNQVAVKWGEKLAALRADDPEGYGHHVEVHKGLAHWMNRKDAVALDWMAKFTRDPLPDKIVWKQSGVTHSSFYWLAVPDDRKKRGAKIVVQRKGQEITIAEFSGVERLAIRLNDRLLDLDRPVTVTSNGKRLFEGLAVRSIATLSRTLGERMDSELMFSAEITLDLLAAQTR